MNKAEILKLRTLLEKAAQGLEDADASTAPGFFPRLKEDGSLVSAGTKINWLGAVKRAAVDLWDTPESNPSNAPDLWEDISYKDGYRIIPETITAGLAFARDEYGWWKDALYKSLIDSNVWTPEAYPAGWALVEE